VEYQQRTVGIVEQLGQVLKTAREEYTRLADVDLLKTSKEETEQYFQRLGMLRKLIGSIESFLDEGHRAASTDYY
jgi:hypothetical protein